MKQGDPNDIDYYLDGVILNAQGNVKSYQTADGYATPFYNDGLTIVVEHFYNIKDWLGTNRGVIDQTGAVLNANDNYPFGLRLPGRAFTSSNAEGERYQFTGHEYDAETNYDYHGARYYNRELGRYMSVDPLANQFFSWSTYNYTMNNPINMIDPDGRGPLDWIKKIGSDQWIWDSNVTGTENTPKGYDYAAPGATYPAQGGTVKLGDNGNWDYFTQQIDEVTATAEASDQASTGKQTNDFSGKSNKTTFEVLSEHYVGYYFEYNNSAISMGSATVGYVNTAYHGSHYYNSNGLYGTGKSIRTELFSTGGAGGIILSTGPASEVPLSALEGFSRSLQLNASAVVIDIGTTLGMSKTPYNSNGDVLFYIGNQISVGLGTPYASGSYTEGDTRLR